MLQHWEPLWAVMRAARSKGVRISWVSGNHDPHIDGLEKKGIIDQSFDDGFELNFSKTPGKIRLEHGDLSNRSDIGYLILRALLRIRLCRFLIRNTETVQKRFWNRMSAKSRNKSDRMMNVNVKDITQQLWFRTHLSRLHFDGITHLIQGHFHQSHLRTIYFHRSSSVFYGNVGYPKFHHKFLIVDLASGSVSFSDY